MQGTASSSPAGAQGKDNGTFATLAAAYEPRQAALWCRMQAPGRQVFSVGMLDDLAAWKARVAIRAPALGARYHVLASARPGVFNFGGDLALFAALIRAGDRHGLAEYGRKCIDMLWANHNGWHAGLTSIALVAGDALGGGFEAALSSDIVIAERDARMGFPEVRFDLFPGMGAWSFLSRRIGGHGAERLMLSGETLEAGSLYEMGAVDILAEPGEGAAAVADAIRREERAPHGLRRIRSIRKAADPVTRAELDRIVALWVEDALALDGASLRMMEKLAGRQAARAG
jgi:DSF synthase